jgi:hypothetical protein
MINLIPNFNPILAFALFMPKLTKNVWLQYALPVICLAIYYSLNGGFVDTLGVFLSLIFATWCARNMKDLLALVSSCIGYFVLANISHGDLLSFATLGFNLSMFTSTVLYFALFKLIEKARHENITELFRSDRS